MPTLLSADDLATIRGRFSRRLLVVLISAVILIGLFILFWPRLNSSSETQGVPLTARITVVGEAGATLPNRLAVLFVNGLEVGRADPSGQLHGYLPRSVHTISDTITVREGQLQQVSFPPDAQAIAYAFPGDQGLLKPDIVTCPQLTLGGSGDIGCVNGPPTPFPDYGIWLMDFLFGVIFLVLSSLAIAHVVPPPRSFAPWLQQAYAYILGACFAGVAIITLNTTGVFQDAMTQLATTYKHVVGVVVAAMGVALSVMMVVVWLRSHFLPPPTR